MAKTQIVIERQVKTDSKREMEESLKSLIQESLENIDELTHKKKLIDESIKSVLGNDSTFKKHEEAAKDATRIKNSTKNEILKRPDVKHVVLQKNEMAEELKGERELLENYLEEYNNLTGKDIIEDKQGKARQIVRKYRVVSGQGRLF